MSGVREGGVVAAAGRAGVVLRSLRRLLFSVLTQLFEHLSLKLRRFCVSFHMCGYYAVSEMSDPVWHILLVSVDESKSMI